MSVRSCLLLAAVGAVSACGTSVQYSASGAKRVWPIEQQAQQTVVVVDIMDGRHKGSPSGVPLIFENAPSKDWADLRSSVRAHAVQAGLSAPGHWVPPAPTSPAAVDNILTQAAERGVQTILFTRLEGAFAAGHRAAVVDIFTALNYLAVLGIGAASLVPSLIVFSLPINTEYASAGVRGFLVDPTTRQVFATFKESATLYDDGVTAWGHDPAGELSRALFHTLEKVFARAAEHMQQRRVGVASPGPRAAGLLFAAPYDPALNASSALSARE